MTSSDPRMALMPTNHSQRSFPERKDSLRRVQEHLKGRRKPKSTKRKQHLWDPGPQVRKSGEMRRPRTLQALLVLVTPPHQQLQPTTECWLWASRTVSYNKCCGEDTINSILHSRKVNSTQYVNQANGEMKT